MLHDEILTVKLNNWKRREHNLVEKKKNTEEEVED